MLLSVSTSKVVAQSKPADSVAVNPPLVLQPAEVDNVYTVLKQGEWYKKHYNLCFLDLMKLNQMIQDQNKENQEHAKIDAENLKELKDLYKQLKDKEVEIVELKHKRIPWYLHPLTYTGLGIIGGVWLAK